MTLRPRRRRAGYLLVLVAVCVSMLSISFLRLAADSAKTDDDAELELASSLAYYAAESGLLVAERELEKLAAPPPTGVWLIGSFAASGTRYTVEVSPGGNPKSEFVLLAKGQAAIEGNRKVTSTLEAQVVKGPGSSWAIRSRKRQ